MKSVKESSMDEQAMYVRAEYRRHGIGAHLVNTLIEHCATGGIQAIELWTAKDGPGRSLYEKQGFRKVDMKGPGFEDTDDRPDEIRMRLDLADVDSSMTK